MCLTVGLFLLGARSEGLCVQFLVFRPKKKNCVSKEFILCSCFVYVLEVYSGVGIRK